MSGIYAITPFTLLDYPGETACIVWMASCNLRCAYCHNPDLARGAGGRVSDDALESFLRRRRGLLSGIVLSGGEPSFNPRLSSYARLARDLGYKVKLDTNGSNPLALRALLAARLIDSVALDYKCPPEKAATLLGTDRFTAAFDESLALLIDAARDGKVKLEVRTTFHPDYLDEADISRMIGTLDALAYQGVYYLQNIQTHGEGTLGGIARPSRVLDPTILTQPRHFTLGYRNFPFAPPKMSPNAPAQVENPVRLAA